MDRLFPEIVGNFRKLPESSAISGNFVKQFGSFRQLRHRLLDAIRGHFVMTHWITLDFWSFGSKISTGTIARCGFLMRQ